MKRKIKMTEPTFRVALEGITELECFKEASKDELKILVAILSMRGASAEELSEKLGISLPRVKACITLFKESGVLTECDKAPLAEVEYEFEPTGKNKTEEKDGAKAVARSIRENDLYEMNREIERILEKTLETREIERITSLHTKKGLSPEYILTLAAFLKDRRQSLSVEYIVREANKLVTANIDTLEELEIYVKDKMDEIAGEMEMRRLFGIYGRTLTKTEREHFSRWMHEYGYSSSIIGEAYDITVAAINKMSLSYINSILTEWHNAGCKTVDDCRAKVNIRKSATPKKANNTSHKTTKNTTAETPKYADFNSEDALLRALERSYSDAES
jgi:DnaD/phage-associated family protein